MCGGREDDSQGSLRHDVHCNCYLVHRIMTPRNTGTDLSQSHAVFSVARLVRGSLLESTNVVSQKRKVTIGSRSGFVSTESPCCCYGPDALR